MVTRHWSKCGSFILVIPWNTVIMKSTVKKWIECVSITQFYNPRELMFKSISNWKSICVQVLYCSTTTREKTPGGSLPSPKAAWKPSCCRACATFASERNERGSVMASSLIIRRFSVTLLCMEEERKYVTHKQKHTEGDQHDTVTLNTANLSEVVNEGGILHAVLSRCCCDACNPQLKINEQIIRSSSLTH